TVAATETPVPPPATSTLIPPSATDTPAPPTPAATDTPVPPPTATATDTAVPPTPAHQCHPRACRPRGLRVPISVREGCHDCTGRATKPHPAIAALLARQPSTMSVSR